MPRPRRTQAKRPIESYQHRDQQRLNNPPVGLVTPETDQEAGRKTYEYDPHLDPQLQWAGKAEHTSFEVPTVSLHVHERIDPRTIIEAARKTNGNGGRKPRGGCSSHPRRTRRSVAPSSSTATATTGATAWWPATACW